MSRVGATNLVVDHALGVVADLEFSCRGRSRDWSTRKVAITEPVAGVVATTFDKETAQPVALAVPEWDVGEADGQQSLEVGGHFVLVDAALLGEVAFTFAEPVGAVDLFPGEWDACARLLTGGGCWLDVVDLCGGRCIRIDGVVGGGMLSPCWYWDGANVRARVGGGLGGSVGFALFRERGDAG